jgi:hypothetical protein
MSPGLALIVGFTIDKKSFAKLEFKSPYTRFVSLPNHAFEAELNRKPSGK